MCPIIFKIGPILIYSYGLMIGIGVIMAMWLVERNAKKEGINHVKILDVILVAFISSIVGGRLIRVFLDWGDYTSDLLKIFKIWEGGFDFYGGLILAVPIGIWYLQKNKLPVLKTVDLVMAYVPLAHAFGRIGCFLEGCCHGTLTTVPWAVNFPKWYSAKNGIIGTPAFIQHLNMHLVKFSDTFSMPVHPTQLYSSLCLFVIFFILVILRKHGRFNGEILSVYLILYSFARFFVEYLRGDAQIVFFGISLYQLCSVAFFVSGIILMIVFSQRKQPKKG
jgi:phosphatidylglycerol:prolipoprotein diacylglycerol transferase